MMREYIKSISAFGIGAAALILGVAYYAAFRQPESVLFLDMLNIKGFRSYYGEIPAFFPSFIHTFSFSLMTSAIVWNNKHHILQVCISWMIINVAFECAQLMPSNFVWGGVFDFWDIGAVLSGGICALIFIFLLKRRQK